MSTQIVCTPDKNGKKLYWRVSAAGKKRRIKASSVKGRAQIECKRASTSPQRRPKARKPVRAAAKRPTPRGSVSRLQRLLASKEEELIRLRRRSRETPKRGSQTEIRRLQAEVKALKDAQKALAAELAGCQKAAGHHAQIVGELRKDLKAVEKQLKTHTARASKEIRESARAADRGEDEKAAELREAAEEDLKRAEELEAVLEEKEEELAAAEEEVEETLGFEDQYGEYIELRQLLISRYAGRGAKGCFGEAEKCIPLYLESDEEWRDELLKIRAALETGDLTAWGLGSGRWFGLFG